jgi:hypothetical protein
MPMLADVSAQPAWPGPEAGDAPRGAVHLLGLPRVDRRAASSSPSRLGYDGVEVMVGIDPVSRDVDALVQLREYHGVPSSPCTRRPCWSPRARGATTPGRSSSAPRSRPTASVPTASWCTRRSAGSAPTRRASSRASAGSSAPRASSSPSRTCSPGAGRAAPRSAPTRPAGTRPSGDYDHLTLDLSHAATSKQKLARPGRRLGRAAHPRPPHRRRRLHQPTVTSSPARGTRRRRRCWPRWRPAASPGTSCSS